MDFGILASILDVQPWKYRIKPDKSIEEEIYVKISVFSLTGI